MKSLFESDAHQEIINRIDKLNENSTANWGKMTVGQMAHHCQYPLNIVLGKNNYNLKPNWFVNILFKKSMYSDKLWRKNLPTVPHFREKENKDFNIEKTNLVALIEELYAHKNKTQWQPHPTFGKLSAEQWGKMQYKHLDHHLRQFDA